MALLKASKSESPLNWAKVMLLLFCFICPPVNLWVEDRIKSTVSKLYFFWHVFYKSYWVWSSGQWPSSHFSCLHCAGARRARPSSFVQSGGIIELLLYITPNTMRRNPRIWSFSLQAFLGLSWDYFETRSRSQHIRQNCWSDTPPGSGRERNKIAG